MSFNPDEFDPGKFDDFFEPDVSPAKPLSRSSKTTLRKAWALVVDKFGAPAEDSAKRADLPEFDVQEVTLLYKAYTIVADDFTACPSEYAAFGIAAGLVIALILPGHVPLKRVWGEWLSCFRSAPLNPFTTVLDVIGMRVIKQENVRLSERKSALPPNHVQLQAFQNAISRHVSEWADLRVSPGLMPLKPALLNLWEWARENQTTPMRVQGIEAGIVLGVLNADIALLSEALSLHESVAHENSLLQEYLPKVRQWIDNERSGGSVVLKSLTPFTHDADKKSVQRRYAVMMEPLKPVWPANPLDQIFITLETEFPWMHRATRLLRLAAKASLGGERQVFKFRPLLLVGPPAAGKSHFARRMVELLGMPSLTLSGAGMSDDKTLTGVPRGWSSARPGVLVELLLKHPVLNPLVIFDELDKVSPSTTNGRAWDALLSMIEPGDAKQHYDQYLMGEMDISNFSWLFLANSTQPLPEPLLTRLSVVHVERPSGAQVVDVGWGMWRANGKESGLPWQRWPNISDSDMLGMAQHYGRSNLRRLRRALEALFFMRLEGDQQHGLLQ